MRISDWSSDVCSSDLLDLPHRRGPAVKTPLRVLDRHIGRGKRRARVGLVLDDLEVDAVIGMLEADITLAKARARFSGRDRSEERRVGKECVSTCRSRWARDH